MTSASLSTNSNRQRLLGRGRAMARADANGKRVVYLRVRRQHHPEQAARWERFAVPYTAGMNVIACLMEIRRNPVTLAGLPTTPITFSAACLEEVCGACTMLINGRVRQACSALVDNLRQPISLAPMTKFPLVRDLAVDRGIMFEELKRIKAWVPVDGYHDLGPGPRLDEATRQWAYELSKCMTCGCCLEACPQYGAQSQYIGATNISWVKYFSAHPTSRAYHAERLETVMGDGGVSDCANAQNCVQVCPKGIPLTNAIYAVKRDATLHAFQRWTKS